jgi:hypothetical protein
MAPHSLFLVCTALAWVGAIAKGANLRARSSFGSIVLHAPSLRHQCYKVVTARVPYVHPDKGKLMVPHTSHTSWRPLVVNRLIVRCTWQKKCGFPGTGLNFHSRTLQHGLTNNVI